jgi:hypothetical protein
MDPRVHVEYANFGKPAKLSLGAGAREEILTVPVVGWKPKGEVQVAGFLTGF